MERSERQMLLADLGAAQLQLEVYKRKLEELSRRTEEVVEDRDRYHSFAIQNRDRIETLTSTVERQRRKIDSLLEQLDRERENMPRRVLGLKGEVDELRQKLKQVRFENQRNENRAELRLKTLRKKNEEIGELREQVKDLEEDNYSTKVFGTLSSREAIEKLQNDVEYYRNLAQTRFEQCHHVRSDLKKEEEDRIKYQRLARRRADKISELREELDKVTHNKNVFESLREEERVFTYELDADDWTVVRRLETPPNREGDKLKLTFVELETFFQNLTHLMRAHTTPFRVKKDARRLYCRALQNFKNQADRRA